MKPLFVLILCCVVGIGPRLDAQQDHRIEREYKLAVADSIVKHLDAFLTEQFGSEYIDLDGAIFTIDRATENFKDTYFDTKSQQLLNNDIGLRHRLRYLDDNLINELLQLKLPDSSDGVQREEIKYTVVSQVKYLDELSRDPVLRFVSPSDRDRLTFQLRKNHIEATALREVLSLSQQRQRYYISDSGGSLATITLDKVRHSQFPFQSFTELEIEINERRYTDASENAKQKLVQTNEKLKNLMTQAFPALIQDQTPKYNKMMTLIQQSLWSTCRDYFMWLIYAGVVLAACIKYGMT